jgi:RecA-family ATPase
MAQNKYYQFLEQVKDKILTAEVFINAFKATGYAPELKPFYIAYAKHHDVNIEEKELDALTRAQDTARQEAALKEMAASLAEKSGALANETDPGKQRELVKEIRRDAVLLEPSAGNGFQFVRMDSLQVRPPLWLVKELIETDSFGCLYGDPTTGKSFIAIELSSCVATGTPFYGLQVKQGPVIFLAGEGQSGLARRFNAWAIARGVSLSGAPLYINCGPVSLIDGDSMVKVIQALERLILEIGWPPVLVILDTWSRVLGGDDSAPSDAAAGIAALDDLRARFGNFAALVVHHEGHTKGRGRGWSGLRAAVDVELRTERGADGVVRLECTKAKDTEPIPPMAFHFATVDLKFNNDEENIVTSAVLTPTGWTPAPGAAVKKPVGKNQALALDVLKQLSAGNENVAMDAWREACKTAGLDRSQFWYVKTGMEKRGLIQADAGIVRCIGVGLGVEIRGLLYSPRIHPTLPTPRNYSRPRMPVNGQIGHSGEPDKSRGFEIPEAPADKGVVKPVRGGTDTAGEVYVFRPEREQGYFRGIAWRENPGRGVQGRAWPALSGATGFSGRHQSSGRPGPGGPGLAGTGRDVEGIGIRR